MRLQFSIIHVAETQRECYSSHCYRREHETHSQGSKADPSEMVSRLERCPWDPDIVERRNRRWIVERIKQGCEIVDIGIDPTRNRRSRFIKWRSRSSKTKVILSSLMIESGASEGAGNE